MLRHGIGAKAPALAQQGGPLNQAICQDLGSQPREHDIACVHEFGWEHPVGPSFSPRRVVYFSLYSTFTLSAHFFVQRPASTPHRVSVHTHSDSCTPPTGGLASKRTMARFSSASMAATPQSPAATPAPLPASSTKLTRNRSSKSIHTPSARFWDEAERSKELRNGFSITLSKSPEALLRPIKKQRTLQHGDETGSAANIPDCEPDSFPESNLGDVYYNVEPKRYWEAALMNGLKKCVGWYLPAAHS